MNQTIKVDAEAGRAVIAGRRVAITPLPGGALRVGGPDGPVLRPISFGERRRATLPTGGGPADRQSVVAAITATSLVAEPARRAHLRNGLSPETCALALWLAGAGDGAPGFDVAAGSVATRIGWAADQIDGADAAAIDRLAMDLVLDHAEPTALSIPSDDGWHRIVFGEPEPVPETTPGPAPSEDETPGSTCDLEELVGVLADDLRRRAESEAPTPAGPIRVDAPSPAPVRSGPTPSTLSDASPAAAGLVRLAVPPRWATTDTTDGHPHEQAGHQLSLHREREEPLRDGHRAPRPVQHLDAPAARAALPSLSRDVVTSIPTSQLSLVPDPAGVDRPVPIVSPPIGPRDRRAGEGAAPATQLGHDQITAEPLQTVAHPADGQSGQATTSGPLLPPLPPVPTALAPTPLRTATDTRPGGLAALPEQPAPLVFAPLERLSPPRDRAPHPVAPGAVATPSVPIRIDIGAIADAMAAALSDEADLRGLRP